MLCNSHSTWKKATNDLIQWSPIWEGLKILEVFIMFILHFPFSMSSDIKDSYSYGTIGHGHMENSLIASKIIIFPDILDNDKFKA